MKQKYIYGLELVNEEQYQEAYDFFCDILKEDITDYKARYYRSTIDFFYLRSNLKTSFEDMKYVHEKAKKEIRISLYPLLCVLSEEFDEHENVLFYGKLAQKYNSQFSDTLYSAMGRASYILGVQNNNDKDYLLQGYNYFIKALELFPDDKIDSYKSLTDVCYRLDRHEECLEYTQQLMSLGVNDGILYFYRGVCQFYLAQKIEDYKDALYNLDKSLNYNPDDEETLYFKGLVLAHLDQEEESDQILLELYNKDKDQNILNGIFHLYASMEQFSKIINFYDRESILNNIPNKFYLAKTLEFFGNSEERILGIKYYKELFEEIKEIDIFQLIFGAYSISNDYQSMLEYCDYILSFNNDDYPNYYIKETKAQCYRLMGKDFQKQEEIYNELHNLGMFEEEYLYSELYINPNRDYKKLTKMLKGKFFKFLDIRMATSIMLYGDYPVKKNFKYALKNVKVLEKSTNHSCSLTLIGRIEELVNHNYLKAYDYYKKAYDIIYDCRNDYCNCAAAFYAHALYNNFKNLDDNTEQEKECYEIIKREILKKNYRQSPNIQYLYAFFALNKVEGFIIEEAIKMLEIARYDSIYDLDILYLLMKCYENIDMNKSSKYLGLFYENLSLSNQLQKEYYLEKMKESKLDEEKIIYPFLNNR